MVAGLLATFMVAGLFGGVLGSVFAGEASAATTSFTMTMTAGSFGVHNNRPATFPQPGSVSGTENSTNGALSGVAISLKPYHTTTTGSTETVFIRQVTPGTATGLISYTGALRITDTLSSLVTIHSPVDESCTSEPIHVNLTGHYDSTTQTATISQTNFTIPHFTTCGLAVTSLNNRYAGTVNEMSLTLQGALVPPPPPATPTTTTLAVSPPSPVLAGTSVTLTATVTSSGQLAKHATGTVKFMVGGAQIGGTQNLVTGTASVTSSSLPTVTGQQLTAVYSGDTKYAASTSPGVPYAVQPKPTVGLSTTALTATRGAAPTTFSVVITNPSTGQSFTHLWLRLRENGTSGLESTQVTLSYVKSTLTACSITLSGRKLITGVFKGTSGACNSAASFALPANGQPMVIPFEISYAANANLGTQTFAVSLQTVSGTTVVPPFTATTVPFKTTVPLNAPYAKGGSSTGLPTLTVVPAPKLTVTVFATPPSSATPEGYVLPLFPYIVPPATTTPHTIYYPSPTGTATFLIDGHVTPTSPVELGIAFTEAEPSTAGLAPGSHTLEVKYNGSSIYNAAHYTTTFTVTTPAPGTAFVCSSSLHSVIVASVVASGTLPPTSNTTQATVSNLNITLHTDPNTGPNRVTALVTATIGLSPGGSITAPSVTPTKSGGIATSSWTGLSGTVTTVKGALGTVVPVDVSSLSFIQGGLRFSCTPNPTPASLGSVTVSGVALAGSPASPVKAGTAVTLTATVVPAANGGQVNFFDGSTNIGTVPVSNGAASLVIQPTTGPHTYSASWGATVPVSLSNTLAYTVDTAPVVTTQPAVVTVNQGTPLTFTAAATGSPVPTVAWQQSTDGGSTWTPAVGTVTSTVTGTKRTSTLTIASVTKTDGSTQFRAVFTNGAGTAITSAVTPNVVVPPTVVTQPANQAVVAGSTATFTAKATGTVLSVQWQVSTNGGSSWSNAPGTPNNTFASRTTLTSTYTTPATTTGDNGTEYQAVFSNGAAKATSNAATLSVTATPPPPAPPAPPTPPAPPAPPAAGSGYRLVASNGAVYSFGTAPFYGSMGGKSLSAPIVGTASTPGDGGYWLVGSDGGIFSFGNATFYGSMGGQALNKPIVGMAATPTGGGYWEVASDGGIFSFGNAKFYGSTGSMALNKPIVGMAATPTGGGYWLVASDGGIFSFGNAGFHGTVAGATTSPIAGIAVTPTGGGYWEVASSGQIFQFGDAALAGTALSQTATIVAISE